MTLWACGSEVYCACPAEKLINGYREHVDFE
eukprot:CAMPEP_0119332424 /NCGR_PEP_ID=MMETSP1333-20130426/82745_1 /TAXON_ID=418940 /ORGANISM="Scyphosphaera apsteinii, Strain RCC1455" /LENGTH=30 /DNA_ID= /DNA_START= /DNA_END= /DNA_ORIENTATION=